MLNNDRLQGILFNQAQLVNLGRPRPTPLTPLAGQNDRVQGILFNQTAVVDLVRRSPGQRLVKALFAKKPASTTSRTRPASNTQPSPYRLTLDNRHREAILGELLSRLQTHP